MSAEYSNDDLRLESRARQSQGRSAPPIYEMAAEALKAIHLGGGILADIGCGRGALWPLVRERFTRYIAVDAVQYGDLPLECEFHMADLDASRMPLPAAAADAVVSLETIEHLENPRAFMRELTRIAKPGGWILISTPNQLSLLSKMTLLLKNQFNEFQESSYPAHLTALLEVDLLRIARECGLVDLKIRYSLSGRIVFTSRYYPRALSRLLPRAFSDNVLLLARKATLRP